MLELGKVDEANQAEAKELRSQIESKNREAESLKKRMRELKPEEFAGRTAPGFYSKAERVAEQKLPPSASGQQILSTLRNSGVKEDEIKWTGLDDFLADKPKVSKQEVQNFLRENQVQIQEVEKGAPEKYSITKNSEESEYAGQPVYDVVDGRNGLTRFTGTLESANEYLNELKQTSKNGVKFENYQLPGGQNYRELLLTLPKRDTAVLDAEIRKLGMWPEHPSRARNEADQPRLNELIKQWDKSDKSFSSGHWDEPNILAHVRFNDRTIDGKKTLFIEEAQSDWHQRGKRQGYKQELSPELKAKIDELEKQRTKAGLSSGIAASARYTELTREIDKLRGRDAVPDAPFKTTWHELAMKRMIRYAAERGYDQVAWTTGEQQAARYDLSKQVEQISYHAHPNGTFDIHVIPKGADRYTTVGEKVPANKLPDIVGKELAEKIVSGGGDPLPNNDRTFTGLDLKVGGEGMKGFYDKILPDFVNKFAKKFGGKVEDAKVGTSNQGELTSDGAGGLVREGTGTPKYESVHSLTITPEMKKTVMQEGQPLFARGEDAPQGWDEVGGKEQTPDLKTDPQKFVAEIVTPMSFQYQNRQGSVPGFIGIDPNTRQLLDPIFQTKGWGAITINPRGIEKTIAALKSIEDTVRTYDPSAADKVAGLRGAFATALQEHPRGGVAIAPVEADLLARHERLHVAQFELGEGWMSGHADLDALSDASEMKTFTPSLERLGYNPEHPHVMTVEAATHIMAGDANAVGGTFKQRAEFLDRYFSSIAETHGTEALERFGDLVADEVLPTLQRVSQRLAQENTVNAKLEGLGPEGLRQLGREFSPAGESVGVREDAGRAQEAAGRGTEEGGGGEAVELPEGPARISPEDFLRRTEVDEENLSEADHKKIALYRSRIDEGKRVPPIEMTLDKDGNLIGHDGVLRAIAMREAGVKSIPVDVHYLGGPNAEAEYLARRTTPPSITVGKADRAMDEARQQELIDAQHLKNSAEYTPEERQKLVESYDPEKMTPEHEALGREVRDQFTKNFQTAADAGALKEAFEHYVTHIWGKNADNPVTRTLLHNAGTGMFATNTPMARRRLFQNAFEGELLGKKLGNSDPIALAAFNGNAFGRVAAARATLDRLRSANVRGSDGRPMVALSGNGRVVADESGKPAVVVNPKTVRSIRIADKVVKGLEQRGDLERLIKEDKIVKMKDSKGNDIYAWDPHDYVTIDHPALRDWNYITADTKGNPVFMKADMKIHPEAVDYIRKQLGKDESPIAKTGVGKALLGAGREAKGVLLSFSPFHLFQEGLRAIMTGISPFGIDRWDPRTDPTLAMGVEHGLTMGKEYRGIEAYEEGRMSGHSKIISKVPGAGKLQDWIQTFLFDKYIPSLKSRAFKHLLADYREAYPEWTINKAAEAAAADTNERFGGINYKRMGRSVATQDMFRVLALAPDWLESEVRFMARSFGEEGKVARKDIAKLAIGMWAATRVLNYVITGQPHNEAPFGVAIKDKDGREKVYSVRTLPTDMLHAISDPGGFLSGRVAPIARAAAQTYTGRDEFGRKVPTHDIASNLLRQVAPIPFQTIAKTMTGEGPEVSTPDQLFKAGGATVYPYRTEAENRAAELASDHSEAGPVDPAEMRQHQAKIKLEGDLRSGKMSQKEFYDTVKEGLVSPQDAKQIMKNVQETKALDPAIARLYTQASRLPAPEFLEVWDKATPTEKAALAKLLVKKRQSYYKKMYVDATPQERMTDPTLKRLERLFPKAPPF
jgi:hypothetical protein